MTWAILFWRTAALRGAEAVRATGQLVMRNIENVLEAGCDGALTGPIERNDIETVKKHIACMQNDDSDDVRQNKMLGTKLVNIAEKRILIRITLR